MIVDYNIILKCKGKSITSIEEGQVVKLKDKEIVRAFTDVVSARISQHKSAKSTRLDSKVIPGTKE